MLETHRIKESYCYLYLTRDNIEPPKGKVMFHTHLSTTKMGFDKVIMETNNATLFKNSTKVGTSRPWQIVSIIEDIMHKTNAFVSYVFNLVPRCSNKVANWLGKKVSVGVRFTYGNLTFELVFPNVIILSFVGKE